MNNLTAEAGTGFVASCNLERGFGFIFCDSTKKKIFFHCTNLVRLPFDDTLFNRRVKFCVGQNEKGQFAYDVEAE